MVKKIIICLMLLMFSTQAFARFGPITFDKKMKQYEVINSTGAEQATLIPSYAITAKSKIYGICVVQYDITVDSCELIVGLYDKIEEFGQTFSEMIAEAETLGGNANTWFIYPLRVETELTVVQGANTLLIIYYGR